MLNITIVEDHKALRESLVDVLTQEGHCITAFESGEAMDGAVDLAAADIMVLDLNLPGEDGISIAKRLRLTAPNLGIVMLTARGEPDERQIGYNSGADIYLTKPSSALELTAAINALARRLPSADAAAKPNTLNTIAMTLTGATGEVSLSAAEVELLTAFATAPNNRLHSSVIAKIASGESELTKATLEVRIVRLRKKMVTAGVAAQPIKVVRHFGYQISTPITVI